MDEDKLPSIEELKKQNPVCPYCEADPLVFTIRDIQFGNGVVVMIAFCAAPECRKLFSVSHKSGAGNMPRLILPNV